MERRAILFIQENDLLDKAQPCSKKNLRNADDQTLFNNSDLVVYEGPLGEVALVDDQRVGVMERVVRIGNEEAWKALPFIPLDQLMKELARRSSRALGAEKDLIRDFVKAMGNKIEAKPVEPEKKKTVEDLVRELKEVTERLKEDRDKLREIRSEARSLLEDKDENIEDLERVAESLSRYV